MQTLNLVKTYDVVSLSGLQQPMVHDITCVPDSSILWVAVDQYKHSGSKLLKMDLTQGHTTVYNLPFAKSISSVYAANNETLYVGDAKRQCYYILDSKLKRLATVKVKGVPPYHIVVTEEREVLFGVMGRVARYTAEGKQKWLIEFPHGITSTLPIYRQEGTFVVTSSDSIVVFEVSDEGDFVDYHNIAPASLQPRLTFPVSSGVRLIAMNVSLFDAAAGYEATTMLILYNYTPQKGKVRELLLRHVWGQDSLVFALEQRVHILRALGATTLVGCLQSIPTNECSICLFDTPQWEEGTTFKDFVKGESL